MKKKLVLNKTTVINLSNQKLNQIRGGVESEYPDICLLTIKLCTTLPNPQCQDTIGNETLSPENCNTDTCYETDYTYCHTGCNC